MRRALAVLALFTGLLAGATGAAEPRFTAERLKLRDVIELEQRAWNLLAKRPPRIRTAKLSIERSAALLAEIAEGLPRGELRDAANDIAYSDRLTARGLGEQRDDDVGWAIINLENRLKEKQRLLDSFAARAASRAQCSDGKDNDGDGTRDARLDSGCSSARDTTERSPLACTLGTTPAAGTATVEGTCSGPFFKLELLAPDGTRLDTTPVPPVSGTEGCRFATPKRLECLAQDGLENPRHRFGVRLGIASGSPRSFRVRITDFAGKVRSFLAARRAAGAADLAVTARMDSPVFDLDRDGTGRVSGTVVVRNASANEARGFRLIVTSSRSDSARAAELTFLPCTAGAGSTTCTLPPVAPRLEVAYAFGLPVTGPGQIEVTFTVQGAGDANAANDRATVSATLRIPNF